LHRLSEELRHDREGGENTRVRARRDAGAALIAFGPQSTSPTPDNRVVVKYWEKWTGTKEKQMRQIVDRYNDTRC
jgi:hypothetical protein